MLVGLSYILSPSQAVESAFDEVAVQLDRIETHLKHLRKCALQCETMLTAQERSARNLSESSGSNSDTRSSVSSVPSGCKSPDELDNDLQVCFKAYYRLRHNFVQLRELSYYRAIYSLMGMAKSINLLEVTCKNLMDDIVTSTYRLRYAQESEQAVDVEGLQEIVEYCEKHLGRSQANRANTAQWAATQPEDYPDP